MATTTESVTITKAALKGSESREISPNRGQSIEDLIAAGDNSMTQAAFRKRYNIDRASQVQLKKIAFMRYQHPDLQQISTFLKGMALMQIPPPNVVCVSR